MRYIKRINTKKQNESTNIIKVLFRVPTSITWHVTCIYWLVSCILFNSRSKIQIEMSPCYRCRAAECRHFLDVYGLWAGRDVYGATPATSQANAFWDLIRRTIQFNWLNWQQARWLACTCQTLSLMSFLYIWNLIPNMLYIFFHIHFCFNKFLNKVILMKYLTCDWAYFGREYEKIKPWPLNVEIKFILSGF